MNKHVNEILALLSNNYYSNDPDKPLPYPSYTNDYFSEMREVFGSRNKKAQYADSDRMNMWDYDKFRKSQDVANETDFKNGSPNWWSEFLSHYEGKPCKLVNAFACYNHSNGQPVYTLGWIEVLR